MENEKRVALQTSAQNGLQKQSEWPKAIELAKRCSTASDALALAKVIPSLVTMSKENPAKTEAEVRILVLSLVKFLNLARSIEGDQISETAQLIIEEFYYMSLADINAAFKQIKLGRYGEFYEGIDGRKIIEAIRQYEQDRARVAENRSHNHVFQQKKDELDTPIPQEVADKIYEAFAPKKKEIPVNEQTKIKLWADEYWKIERDWREKNPDEKNRYKFEKEYMTLEQFIKNKIEVEAPPTAENNI